MAKKLTSTVGIDIGSYSIKVAEIRQKGKEVEISALGMVDTPEGAVDHTGVYNSDAVGDALKGLLKQVGVSVPQSILSISGQASVLVRTLEVPRMTPAELKEHMQWEINRNIPFAESTVLSDYKVLPDDDPNSANMEVVMAIAPQSAIDTLVATNKRAGKQAAGIDVEPLALARTLEMSYGETLRDQVVCMVEIGGKTTAINIYRNGRLLMPRQIPIGGEQFTRAIADGLGLSIEDAEAKKRSSARIPESEIAAAEQGGFMPTFGMTDPNQGATQQFGAYNPFSDDVPANPFVEPTADAPSAYNPFSDPSASAVVPPNPFAEPDPMASVPASPFAEPVADTGLDPTGYGAVLPDQPVADPYAEPAGDFNPFDDASAMGHDSAHMPVGGASDEDPEVTRIFNAYRPILEEFVAEVRRSVDYFRSRGGEVNCIYLLGGGSKLEGLDRYIGASVALPCQVFDASINLKLNEKKVAPGYLEDNKQEFAVALGTALHIVFDA